MLLFVCLSMPIYVLVICMCLSHLSLDLNGAVFSYVLPPSRNVRRSGRGAVSLNVCRWASDAGPTLRCRLPPHVARSSLIPSLLSPHTTAQAFVKKIHRSPISPSSTASLSVLCRPIRICIVSGRRILVAARPIVVAGCPIRIVIGRWAAGGESVGSLVRWCTASASSSGPAPPFHPAPG